MPALDFPASPTIGQTYPNPPIDGIPTYEWDGARWLAAFALGVEPLDKTGGTMEGDLVLWADPNAPMEAATKQYVDAQIASAIAALSSVYQPKDAQLFAGIPIKDVGAAYTLLATDAQRCIRQGAASSPITVPPNSSVPFPIGTVCTILPYGVTTTLVPGAGVTLYYQNGSSLLSGTRTIANVGICTILKVLTDTWAVGGSGIT